MTDPRTILDFPPAVLHDRNELPWRERGAELARSVQSLNPRGSRRVRSSERSRKVRAVLARIGRAPEQKNAEWVLDNVRLVRSAEKEAREFVAALHRLPEVIDASGAPVARVCLVAREYLALAENDFTDDSIVAFIEGYQDVSALNLGEIWMLKTALQCELLDRFIDSTPEQWPTVITSLRRLAEMTWKEIFDATSRVERILEQDPAQAYSRMDFDSRDRYRDAVGKLGKNSPKTECEIAETAIALARRALAASDGSRAAVRRTHVGYYLADKGLPRLEAAVGYAPPVWAVPSRLILKYPTTFYLVTIELLTFLVVFGMLVGLDSLTPVFAGLILLLLPATQAAVSFVNNLISFLVPPRALPKLDFSDGIPDDCITVVAVPSLLLSEAQVHDLVLDLEIRFLANRDPNVYFALLTDSPDSDQQIDQHDALVEVGSRLIEGLNARYRSEGRSPFLLLHRHRAYNESEGRWMGWERKRGKLLDLNRLLRGEFDAFPVKVGDVSVLPRVRYVITLDSDTQLPRDSAAKLIGTIAHPLNQAVVDPVSRIVVEGYGILQPRVGISIQSASRSRLAALYSGQTGFDIYTRAISDVYQDLFGEGIFTGKGIYEVDVLRETLEDRFPENALLSHDLIEGAYARAALVSDIEVVDDYPSHFSSYNRRKHRWVRGDWQILRWVRGQVPDYHGRMIPNPISLISQWKILDNLRRSLFEPSLLLLLLGSWFYLPGAPGYWTAAAVAVLMIPAYSNLLFAPLHAPHGRKAIIGWARATSDAFSEGNAIGLFSLVFLLHQALLSIDAIIRSLGRVFVTGRKLLEWETAAEAEAALRPKSTVDIYLEWTPWISLALAAAVWLVRPAALPAAAPILTLWFLSRPFSGWLNRRPRSGRCRVKDDDAQLLRNSAERIYRFFRDWSSPATNWLIPDSVREDGAAELRLSPTNLGMVLNARIAGVHLGLVPLAEFVFETRQTLERVVALPKFRGHLFNWYDVSSLTPLDPQFVSSVDSGNLAAALWTLKQAALAFAGEPPAKRGVTRDLAEELHEIAATCEGLVRDMDFRFLYNKRRRSLSIGYNVTAGKREAACYDLLASEARIAVFVAVAKGDIPQQAWFHLGRVHTSVHGDPILLSWTGTMFEYLMPVLWMRHYPGTIAERSARNVVRAQREYARRKGVPWGISESACLGNGGEAYGYVPFGVPELALKRASKKLVISPYSTMLALTMDPQSALENLHHMEDYGWNGRYGFYEAIEYTRSGAEPIRSWMAHHQGMSLLAVVNLLFDNPLQHYFHAEPQVLATELLLHERVPVVAVSEPDLAAAPDVVLEPA